MARKSTVSEPALVDAENIAERYGFTRKYVLRLAREGRIPHVKFEFYVRFDPLAVAAWVDEHRRGE
jgi:hypothetical protein